MSNDFVVIAFWRHWRDLPADRLDPLVLVQYAGRNHRLQLGHGKSPTRHSLGPLASSDPKARLEKA